MFVVTFICLYLFLYIDIAYCQNNYEHILFKLDSSCLNHIDYKLADYMKENNVSERYVESLNRILYPSSNNILNESTAGSLYNINLGQIDENKREAVILEMLKSKFSSKFANSIESNNNNNKKVDHVKENSNQLDNELITIEKLKNLGIIIVKNPKNLEGLLDYAKMLPCLSISPEVDKTMTFSNENVSSIKELINDESIGKQWYLFSYRENQNAGSEIIDAWLSLISNITNYTSINIEDIAKINHTETLIAILDSGCSKHKDLIDSLYVPDKYCKSKPCYYIDFTKNDLSKNDEKDIKLHGTSTAGIIAAKVNNKLDIAGICPFCKVVCLKIYDNDKQIIKLSAVLKALDFILEYNITISNHSYGGFGLSSIEYYAHKILAEHGHLAVCSSGNNNCNTDITNYNKNSCDFTYHKTLGPFTPASFDLESIISVGSTDKYGNASIFSNFGNNTVDIFAPGEDILTLYGESSLAYVKGTSFSAPIVTGIAGFIKSIYPDKTGVEIKEKIFNFATYSELLEGKAKHPKIVSLYKAINDNSNKIEYDFASNGIHDNNYNIIIGFVLFTSIVTFLF